MKNLLIIKLSVWLLLFSGLGTISAAQVPALPDEIPAGATVAQVTVELRRRINNNTATCMYLKKCLDFGVNPDTRVDPNRLQTLLMVAACYANLPLVRILLEYGANVDLFDLSGDTILNFLGTQPGRRFSDDVIAIIDLLDEKGVDFNARDSRGKTLVMRKVKSPKIVSHLIAKNVDLDVRDLRGRTALILSVESDVDREGVVTEKLIQAGADLNVQKNDFPEDVGTTALMRAAASSFLSLEKLKMLIFAGANPLLKDRAGRDANSHFKAEATAVNMILSAEEIKRWRATGELLSRYSKLYAKYGKDVALEKLKEVERDSRAIILEKCVKMTATDVAGEIIKQTCTIS